VNVPLWFGGYGAAAIVLAAGGAAKAVRPAGTARALRRLRVPASPAVVRTGGAAEMAVGGAALVAGGRWPAVLVLVSYAAFTAVVAVAARRGSPLSSCGCFGEVDAPPTNLHAVLNAAFAALAAAAVARAGAVPSVVTAAGHVAGGRPVAQFAFWLLTATAAYEAYLAMAVAPRTAAAGRAP
jgi:hypothetical protein